MLSAALPPTDRDWLIRCAVTLVSPEIRIRIIARQLNARAEAVLASPRDNMMACINAGKMASTFTRGNETDLTR